MADTQSILAANDWMKNMQPGNQWAANPLQVATQAQDLANKTQYNRNMQQDLLNSQQGFMTRVQSMAGGVSYSMGTDPEMDYGKAMKRFDLFEQTTPFAKPLLEYLRSRITPDMTPTQVQQTLRDHAFSTLAPPTQQGMYQPQYQWDTSGGVPTIYAIPQEGGRSVTPNAPYPAGRFYPPYQMNFPNQQGQPVPYWYPPNVPGQGAPSPGGGQGGQGGQGTGTSGVIHPNGKPVGPNNPPRLNQTTEQPPATTQTVAPPASPPAQNQPPAAVPPVAGQTEQPPTTVVPPTAMPPAPVVPPTAVPPAVPPTAMPPAPVVPPTAMPPTAVRPPIMPPAATPPAAVPPTAMPPAVQPGTPPSSAPPGSLPSDYIPGVAQGPGGGQIMAQAPNTLMTPPPAGPAAGPAAGDGGGLVNRLMSAINPIGTANAMPPPVGTPSNAMPPPGAPPAGGGPAMPTQEILRDYTVSPKMYDEDSQLVNKAQYLRFPMEQALHELKGGETITAAGKLPLRVAEDWARGVLKGVFGVDWPVETPGHFQSLQVLMQTLQEKTGLSNTAMGQLHTILAGTPGMDRNEWANSDVLKQNLAIVDSLVAMHKQWTAMTPQQRAAITPPGDTNYAAYVRQYGSTVDLRPFAQRYMSNDQLDRLSKDASHMTDDEAKRYLRFKSIADNPNIAPPAAGGIPGSRY